MNKQNKGITLVALVITIIVLIILAAVSINAIINQGLIENAKTAADDYEEEAKREQSALAQLEQEFENLKGSWVQQVNADGTITITNKNDPDTTLAPGDIVTYGEQTEVTEYTVSRKESGRINNPEITEDQTVSKKTLTWKVLGVNENGRLVLISTEEANPVNVYGRTGGDNAAGIIDDMYNKFYGNTKKGTVARGIKLNDFELFKYAITYNLGITSMTYIKLNEWEIYPFTYLPETILCGQCSLSIYNNGIDCEYSDPHDGISFKGELSGPYTVLMTPDVSPTEEFIVGDYDYPTTTYVIVTLGSEDVPEKVN